MKHKSEFASALPEEIAETVLPGAGAYVATRFASRAVYTVAERRAPALAKHAAVAAGAGACALVWAYGDRVEKLAEYRDAILVGAGVAAIQSVLQAYLPRYGWIVGDLPNGQQRQVAAARPTIEDYFGEEELEEVPLLPAPSGPKPSEAQKEEDLLRELSDYSELNDSTF